jgi:ubiquinone/menaquinone biosynthesis C-methylase UbiE
VIYFLLILALIAALVIWWLVFESEGVYLGRGIVVRLYDLYAGRYDKIKEFDPQYDHVLLAKPLMGAIVPHTALMVLDVATGTGRLPDALLNHTQFTGSIIGLDLSRRMLRQAAAKFVDDGERVTLVWSPAETLPFDDNAFDVVTCLEALEFVNYHPLLVFQKKVGEVCYPK